MVQFKMFNSKNRPTLEEKNNLIQFLFDNLQEYGDSKSDIGKAINYALKETDSFGGFILVSFLDNEILGIVVING